ncbi:hypothetical protein KCP73_00725 [Salmonella enterica subsp. enterica]|nr:hypothetical protein KCP73_00725 [Salmonella enterica subsp. enterica]
MPQRAVRPSDKSLAFCRKSSDRFDDAAKPTAATAIMKTALTVGKATRLMSRQTQFFWRPRRSSAHHREPRGSHGRARIQPFALQPRSASAAIALFPARYNASSSVIT